MHKMLNGWLGEKATSIGLRNVLDNSIYCLVENVILPVPNGTTQIDLIVCSVFGIFVVEVKNFNGLIHGDANAAQWFHFSSGGFHAFRNPLRQNYGHVKAMAEFLNLPESAFVPAVFFVGNSAFANSMPSNVLSSGVAGYIESFQSRRLTDPQAVEAARRLRENKANFFRTRQHVADLHQRLEDAERCPVCHVGRVMMRTSSRDGRQFWGCSNFPSCQFTRSLTTPFPQERLLKPVAR